MMGPATQRTGLWNSGEKIVLKKADEEQEQQQQQRNGFYVFLHLAF